MRGVETIAVRKGATTLQNVKKLIAPAGGQAGAARPNGRAGQFGGAQLAFKCSVFALPQTGTAATTSPTGHDTLTRPFPALTNAIPALQLRPE